MIKILGGKYKNKQIPILKKMPYRPSTAKMKESIFNILFSLDVDIRHCRALDLFCGSGAFGFEMLSRGAQYATFIDINYEAINMAKDFARELRETTTSSFFCMDSLNLQSLPHKLNMRYNLVFLDPPYDKGLAQKSLDGLLIHNLLDTSAIIMLELAKKEVVLTKNDHLTFLSERNYGNSKLIIIKYDEEKS